MTIITAEATRAFVTRVKFAEPARLKSRATEPPAETLKLKDTDAQALIVGSGLVVAAQNVPGQVREDIVNCTLFAQLAASGQVSDPSNVGAWYQAYFNALATLGWAQSSRQFEEFKSSGTNLEAHKSIVKIISSMLGPGAAAVSLVSDMLGALQSMNENSPWITLFNKESTSTRSARFQVATAQKNAGGLVDIALVAFDLQSKAKLVQVLFFKFQSSKVRLKYAQGTATIYEAALAQSRDAVADRLAAYRAAYVGEVKFPPLTTGAPKASRRKSR